MAESAVDFLLQTLASLLQQEASLLQGLRSSLREIQLELQSMHSFLKDADRKKCSDDRVKTWVGQVREVVYEVEDIIDEYLYHVANEERGGGLPRRVCKIILLPRRYCYKRQIASKLQEIRSKIFEISNRSKRYGLLEEGSTSKMQDDGENWQRSGEYLSRMPDDGIVGIEKNKNFLIQRLTDENGRPESVVLCVVGMGGLGKTTLVTKAYNSPNVKNHFDCHAWITVSQSYKLEELLRSLVKELYKSNKKSVPDAVREMNTSDLFETVIDYLKDKRYVIVLDDVWEPNVWRDIHVAFQNNECGGRVIITTRKENVSSSFGDENVLQLKPLGNDDALVLFCNKAFLNKSCPPELKQYAESLVQKCEGLPLAIVAIGGLMSTKGKSSLEWKKIEDNLSWQLSSNKELDRMKSILLLSYNDLPYTLKHCFLYCSLFPEDYAIQQNRLIRLWVAEGFVEERGEQTLEEVAAEYVKDLICRSMLQVVEATAKVSKEVRMHDVLRELAISIGREEKFCNVHVSKEEIQSNEARRLSLYNCIGSIQSSTCHLRSLMLFSTEIPSLSFKSIASSIKLLRVLDLQGSSIDSVPDELVELFNLRYLSLKNTNVEVLPKSIGRLQNLQTLDIKHSKIKSLPKEVAKLRELRHLNTYSYLANRLIDFDFYDFPKAPAEICNLKCLRTLQCIGADDETVRKVGNLTQLRRLVIGQVKRYHGVELCASLQKLNSLLTLTVMAITEEEILDLDVLSHPPIHLEFLLLSGRMERLPPWIRSLKDLTRVVLHWSQLNDDPLSSLQALPNLVVLCLIKAYIGKELCIRCGCFLKLKQLVFSGLLQLDRIYIEKGSMICIEEIVLVNCPELKSAPEGIQYLTCLQSLALRDMPGELVMKIQGDEGVNLQHIPQIIHFNSTKCVCERLIPSKMKKTTEEGQRK
ncbi:disease resistance protein RPM1-like protein [Cinnamomum micranthum f. kanehirae]|uniref:Disease resistance protein RPM1-like protein n=1 Tax=Cinnamomum micranthum f. kanehirae TaxID=337451 RepID=A0A443P278_9MAGN|nr:disease resistance protein RPM1-like protein [Cinnamomum micranthum f. kanehirae]